MKELSRFYSTSGGSVNLAAKAGAYLAGSPSIEQDERGKADKRQEKEVREKGANICPGANMAGNALSFVANSDLYLVSLCSNTVSIIPA